MNMNPSESKMYRLHLNEDVTYEKLIRTINNVEIDIPITKKNNETKKISENSELDLLIDKIDKMALIIEKTKHNDTMRITTYCKICMRKGHTEYDCRNKSYNKFNSVNFENRKSYHNAGNYVTNTRDNKIEKLKNLLGKPITGRVADYIKLINKPNERLKKLMSEIPEYFDLYKTICKNEIILDEMIKSIELRNKVNNVNARSTEHHFDIIKCNFKINEKEIAATLDTGANYSVISSDLVRELNLPINIKDISSVSLANNNVVYTKGSVNVPIQVNEIIFPCQAIILQNAAQPLLVGTNWLAHYKTNLDFSKNILSIPFDNDCIETPFSSLQIRNTGIKQFNNTSKTLKIFSAYKQILNPKSIQPIEFYIDKNKSEKIPTETIFYIDGACNKNYLIGSGITNCNNLPGKLYLFNTTSESKIIEKNEVITNAVLMTDLEMYQLDNNKCEFDVDMFLKNFQGSNEQKIAFEEKLSALISEKIEAKNHETEHHIELLQGSKPFNCKPYRTTIKEKEEIKKR
ncbi:hypothetical protein COBT_003188 [Conglomerata obtusa]